MDRKEMEELLKSVQNVRIPILILDEKWHELFSKIGKPDTIVRKEAIVSEALANQGRLNDEMKQLKRAKNVLMQSIVANMDGAEEIVGNDKQAKKLEEDKRLINEINEKIEACEDALFEAPREIKKANEELMLECMLYCYDILRKNENEIEQINAWISKVRRELKKNIIIKQNREQDNEEIYGYLHAVLGVSIVDAFDVKYEEEGSVEE